MAARVARRLGQQQGQSLVEFALVVPLLLLMLVGIGDLGRMLYYYVGISNSAFEGARVATNVNNSDTAVRSAVKAEAAPLIAIADADIAVAPSPSRTEGQPVTVTVAYDFRALTPLVNSAWGGGPLRIQSSTVMVVQ